jgi:hypothetical protein
MPGHKLPGETMKRATLATIAIAALTLTGCSSAAPAEPTPTTAANETMSEANFFRLARVNEPLYANSTDANIKKNALYACELLAAPTPDAWVKTITEFSSGSSTDAQIVTFIGYSISTYCPEHADKPLD